VKAGASRNRLQLSETLFLFVLSFVIPMAAAIALKQNKGASLFEIKAVLK
jgi:hypothetical protein